MNIEKMREEFEAHYAEEFSVARGYKPSPEEMVSMRDGDSYGLERGYLNGYWKGWQASRAAIEVELPELFHIPEGTQSTLHAMNSNFNHGVYASRKAIESLGLKVKQP